MKTRNRKMLVFFWIACLVIALTLLFSPTQPGRAQQQPQTITGTGTVRDGAYVSIDNDLPLTMTFPPAGGPVTGSAFLANVWVARTIPTFDNPNGTDCYGTVTVTFSGTFAGGDGGYASGDYVVEHTKYPGPCGSDTYADSNIHWEGWFYANGTGYGYMLAHGVNDKHDFDITFSPAEFQAAMGPTVTPAILDTPTPGSTEEGSVPLIPVSTEEVVAAPASGSPGDCSSDPLNSEACMGTPLIKQGLAMVVSVGATLATILAVSLGNSATSAGEAAAGTVTGTATASTEAVEETPTPIVTEVGPITFPDPKVSEESPGESGEVGIVDPEASDKFQLNTPLPPGLEGFVKDMETINQKNIIDKKFYVVNPLQGDPILVFHGLAIAVNKISDYTAGQWTGSEGLTCQGFVDETIGPVQDAVLKKFGPGAKAERVVFEEKSTLHPDNLRDWLDSLNEENHNLIKVTLPDKTVLAVDFHQHNLSGGPPIVRDYNDVKKIWKVYLGGKNEFVETIKK